MPVMVRKYPLHIVTHQAIQMPYGYELLSVHVQQDVPYLFALVASDLTTPMVPVPIATHQSDTEFTQEEGIAYNFIGMYSLPPGIFTFNVFQLIP